MICRTASLGRAVTYCTVIPTSAMSPNQDVSLKKESFNFQELLLHQQNVYFPVRNTSTLLVRVVLTDKMQYPFTSLGLYIFVSH